MKSEEIHNLSDAQLGYQISKIMNFNASVDWCENLCTSLDAIAEIEKEIIKQKLGDDYTRILAISAFFHTKRPSVRQIDLITASARQRAEACLLALQQT